MFAQSVSNTETADKFNIDVMFKHCRCFTDAHPLAHICVHGRGGKKMRCRHVCSKRIWKNAEHAATVGIIFRQPFLLCWKNVRREIFM